MSKKVHANGAGGNDNRPQEIWEKAEKLSAGKGKPQSRWLTQLNITGSTSDVHPLLPVRRANSKMCVITKNLTPAIWLGFKGNSSSLRVGCGPKKSAPLLLGRSKGGLWVPLKCHCGLHSAHRVAGGNWTSPSAGSSGAAQMYACPAHFLKIGHFHWLHLNRSTL